MTAPTKAPPEAQCPIRPGDACSLCQPGATGPQDCGLVYLVMSDPDLREELNRVRRLQQEESRRTRSPEADPDAQAGGQAGALTR